MAAGNILDTFFYSLKIKDDGVESKLGAVEKRLKATEETTAGVSSAFGDLGQQLKTSLESVLPGADRVISALGKIGVAARNSGAGQYMSRIKLPGAPTATAGGAASGATARAGAAAGAAANAAGAAGAAGGAGGAGGAAAGAAAGLGALGPIAIATAVALAGITVAAATLTKAFVDGTEALSESRKAARDAGVNNTQMAATEQYAKSMGLNKNDARDAIKTISETTQAGWVKSREFGNVFGIGNEQTQMMRKHGIRTSDSNGELRNSTAIFEDIGKKMKSMSRDSGIAFGQFFGMTKDFATGVYDSKISLSEYVAANKESIATQAAGMEAVKKYERAQQELKNAWDDFSIAVASEVIPVITDMINWVTKSAPVVKEFGESIYGTVMMIRDAATKAFDFIMNARTKLIDGLFGSGTTSNYDDLLAKGANGLKAGVELAANTFSEGVRRTAEYGRQSRQPTDTSKVDREMRQNTSLNAKAANVQLEAANLMKTATAKFGLSIEEYAAMWAATSGRASGLIDGGGKTNSDFRDIYRKTVGEYATSESAIAMFGRGQPMMQQMPAQYAIGLGVTPLGLPAHSVGLSRAKSSLQDTSGAVGPVATPFGGSGARTGTGGASETNIQIDKIEVITQSNDAEAVNRAVGQGLKDELRMAVNTHNDGRKA